MVRVIKVTGEKGNREITLRVTDDCMCEDQIFTEDQIVSGKFCSEVTDEMGCYALDDICGLQMIDNTLEVTELPTVEDAIKWCKSLSRYQKNGKCVFEVSVKPRVDENGDPEPCMVCPKGADSREEFSEITLINVTEDADENFVVPACVTSIKTGVFNNTPVKKVKSCGTVVYSDADMFVGSGVDEITFYEYSYYDLAGFFTGVSVGFHLN